MSACDAGSGQVAADRYADLGVTLTYVQRQPGFVCRVNDAPSTDPCVNTPPTDAYWALWWTDGQSGSWTYSSIGVTGLQVPEGGAVALAWQSESSRRAPALAAPASSPTPSPTKSPSRTPTPKPTTRPTTKPTTKPTSQAPSPTATTSSTTSSTTSATTRSPTSQTSEPAPSPSITKSPSPSESNVTTGAATHQPTATPTDAVPPEARTDEGSTRVPTWLTLTILAMLLIAIAMSAYAARRRTRG